MHFRLKKNISRLTPILDLAQTFMNERALMHAIVSLPEERNILGTVTSIYLHPKFKYLEGKIATIKDHIPTLMKMAGKSFNIKNLWSGKEKISYTKIKVSRTKMFYWNHYFQMTEHFPLLVK